ncbi:MAG TPA: hypothetical protein VFV66_06285, partial [Nonomuraea sp.]|nr:hypothetical protein [Nonomuraea sp.]
MVYGATKTWEPAAGTQPGVQPASAGLGGQQGQGQQMVPADAVGTILDLALKHGPDVLKGIL